MRLTSLSSHSSRDNVDLASTAGRRKYSIAIFVGLVAEIGYGHGSIHCRNAKKSFSMRSLLTAVAALSAPIGPSIASRRRRSAEEMKTAAQRGVRNIGGRVKKKRRGGMTCPVVEGWPHSRHLIRLPRLTSFSALVPHWLMQLPEADGEAWRNLGVSAWLKKARPSRRRLLAKKPLWRYLSCGRVPSRSDNKRLLSASAR